MLANIFFQEYMACASCVLSVPSIVTNHSLVECYFSTQPLKVEKIEVAYLDLSKLWQIFLVACAFTISKSDEDQKYSYYFFLQIEKKNNSKICSFAWFMKIFSKFWNFFPQRFKNLKICTKMLLKIRNTLQKISAFKTAGERRYWFSKKTR